jgi:hypothetical protein
VFGLLSTALFAQTKIKVVKFNGESFECDDLTPGKTIVCKIKGQDKIKLSYSEVKYYTVPYKMYLQKDKGPVEKVDTTKMCMVPEDGREYTVQIANDSVFIGSIDKTINDVPFTDYYIFNSKNVQVLKIDKTIEAITELKKYFGGHCPEFDKLIVQYTPKFKKPAFPYEQWEDLLYNYTIHCQKK